MRARIFVLAGALACAACAQTEEVEDPFAEITDLLMRLSLVQTEGAIHIVDPRIVAKPAFDGDRSAMPEYPVESLRAFEEGDVTLELCVSADGKVTDSAIAQSSSYERLDQASLDWVNKATFTPAKTADGPVAVCGFQMSYVWKLSGSAFPSLQLLSNAYALDVSPIAPEPGEVWLDIGEAPEGVEPPKLKYEPPPPVYPQQAGAAPAPFRVDLCVGTEGRPVAVEGLDTMNPMEGVLVMTWLNGLRFEPAMQNGAPVNVCGFGWQMRWRGAN